MACPCDERVEFTFDAGLILLRMKLNSQTKTVNLKEFMSSSKGRFALLTAESETH